MTTTMADDLKKYIRDIPDFPKPGILFRDITTLLANPTALKSTVDQLAQKFKNQGISKIIGIESRGFIMGTPLSYLLDVGFVPVRKKGKLPHKTNAVSYALEYGEDTLEIHTDAIADGEKVLIIDDLLATGGTARATCDLVEKSGGKIAGLGFIIELSDLNGRQKLAGYPVESLVIY